MAASDVLVASPKSGGGGILTAPAGTAIPTDIDGSVSAFTGVGLIGEDGVTMTINRDTEDVFAWGGDKVRVIQTSHSVQLQIPFLETNEEVLAIVFGVDNVDTTGTTTTVHVKGSILPHFALVVDAEDGDKLVRIAAADAQVIEQDDIVFVHSAPTIYTVTIELFEDDNGDKAVLMYDTGDGS
jgi:hypothetical protein